MYILRTDINSQALPVFETQEYSENTQINATDCTRTAQATLTAQLGAGTHFSNVDMRVISALARADFRSSEAQFPSGADR